VHNINDVRQIAVYTAEPLVPGLEAEIAIAKWKKYKSPSNNQILAELLQAGGYSVPQKAHQNRDSHLICCPKRAKLEYTTYNFAHGSVWV
jgi:hypothetical protein